MTPIEKVLVIKLSALGDFVLAFPAFERIRAAHPRAKITLLTTAPFEGDVYKRQALRRGWMMRRSPSAC